MVETIEKKYTLRDLQSKDVFPMFRIISKIGVNEFKACFQTGEVKEALANMTSKEPNKKKTNIEAVGIQVLFEIVTVIIAHIGDAEQEIYTFLSGIAGMDKKEIEELDMITFTEMIVDVFKKDEFKDFILVVSKLFK